MTAFLFMSVILCGASAAQAETLDTLTLRLPESILAWTKADEDALYDDRTIFDYIDGAAEVYRAYGMERCFSRRYETPGGPALMLDIFDMGSSDDAYGVFTYDRDGEAMSLGQGAVYRSGWLGMWKDRFFVSLYATQETKATREAVLKLAEAVSRLIRVEGSKPRILSFLPSDGLKRESVRFFYDHAVLNRHYFLAGDNILNLGRRTRGALASYERKPGSAQLLLLEYPDGEMARKAHAAFLKHYIPEADDSGMAFLENGTWCGLRVHGKWLAIVLESADRELAVRLLEHVTANVR